MMSIINKIRQELSQKSDEKTKQVGQTFFKENIKLYGVKAIVVNQIARKYFKDIKNNNKKEIFDLCEKLWEREYLEESSIACIWSYFIHKNYETGDFIVFEKWVNNYINNWASCDTFCNHTIGTFIEMYPQYLSDLKKWAKSKNRWVRRASAVSLIVPAKQGKFLTDIFEIADILLLDKDDIVQKGYGWMLKVASHKNQKQVFDYVMSKKDIMPRTALRYAIEKMPRELKIQAMKK